MDKTENRAELEAMGLEAIKKADGGFTGKELAMIGTKLEKMETAGLDKVDSCRAYLSMLVMITGDLLVEIPKTSKKYSDVDKINAHIVEMWEYFASRNQRQEFDTDGMCLGMVYNSEFKEAV